MTGYAAKASDRVVAVQHDGEAEVFIVTCGVCGELDRIDYGPFERRCPDLDTADAAAQLVADDHVRSHNANRAKEGWGRYGDFENYIPEDDTSVHELPGLDGVRDADGQM